MLPTHIRTHVITGFLGVGKTTTLQYLLKQKPSDENWVVLLNEFGETGLDADFLSQNNVAIHQVAGGCLCCDTKLFFQTKLNQIIRFENPHKLFIEPSGLGHPDKIIEILRQDQYAEILKVEPVLTLIDARQLSNLKYREHEIYQRQLAIADIFIANKCDLATVQDIANFEQLLLEYRRPGLQIQEGELSFLQLESLEAEMRKRDLNVSPAKLIKKPKLNNSEFFTQTFHFDESDGFDFSAVKAFLQEQAFIRVKGLLASAKGVIKVNSVSADIGISLLDLRVDQQAKPYRLEIIHDSPIDKNQVLKILNRLKR